MTDRELFEKALEALEQHSAIQHPQQRHYRDAAIDALRERLAQPEQEPFGYFQLDLRLDAWVQNRHSNKGVAFYTAPQQEPVIDKAAAIRIATALGWEPRREWVGLTAAEFRKAVDGLEDLEDCWVALEHALKEKNT